MDEKLQVTKIFLALFLVLFSTKSLAQITEGFETGLPGAYTTSTSYSLSSGTWTGASNLVIKSSTTGVKTGSGALQLKSSTGAQVTTPMITSGVGTISFYAMASAATNGLQVRYSTDGTNFTQIGSTITGMSTATPTLYTFTLNSSSSTLYIQFYRTAATIYIDDVAIANYTAAPLLSTTPTSLTGFTYVQGFGPSAEQSFAVTGTNTTAGITVTPPANYEISSTSGSGFGTSSITLASTGGTVYTRLASGLSVNSYSGNVVLSSTGATNVNVAVSGIVTNPPPPTATAATSVSNTGFTANWNTVSGASSYILDVYENIVTSSTSVSEPFDAGTTTSGWTFSGVGTYTSTSTGYFGNSAPSIKFDSTGDIITSPVFTTSPTKISFWMRGAGTGTTGSALLIEGKSGATWTTIGTITPISESIVNKIYDNLNGYTQFRFTFTKVSGNLAFDDFVATTETIAITPISGSPFTINSPDVSKIITGLELGKTYYYKVKAVVGSTTTLSSNEISVTTNGTIWTGNSWTNGIPTNSVDAIINGDYPGTGTDAAITAATLKVNSGKTLTINSSVTTGNVENNGAIVVASDGNFVQSTGATYIGTGTFSVQRNTISGTGKYVFWSSPVINQNIFDIYGAAGIPQYVMEYNSSTDYYNVLANPAVSVSGKAYSVKVPVANAPINFVGVPNNGDITVSGLSSTINANGNSYNLIGNPYPSNIDLLAFKNANTNIDNTLYFWDASVTPSSSQNGGTTIVSNWATYNKNGSGTWVGATSGVTPTGTAVKSGQGFIVSLTSGNSVVFNNSMRNASASTFFNKSSQNLGEGKFWLQLKTPTNAYNSLAITYGEGAQNTLDAFDSKVRAIASDAFYSVIGSEKLAIQGRADFVDTDIVTLGNKQFEAGQHTISLVDKTGVFSTGQDVYLRDKLLGTYSNLQTSPYSFSADAGTFEDRFEIVYKPGSALATSENIKSGLQVYRTGEVFVVKNSEKLDDISVFDSSGRLISSFKPNANSTEIALKTKGVYIFRITSGGKTENKKILE